MIKYSTIGGNRIKQSPHGVNHRLKGMFFLRRNNTNANNTSSNYYEEEVEDNRISVEERMMRDGSRNYNSKNRSTNLHHVVDEE